MREKIYSDIANAQEQINELKELKEYVNKSETENIRVRIETKHWHGYCEKTLLTKKHRIFASKDTMQTLIDTAISLKNKEIDNFIDKLINNKLEAQNEK